MGDYFTKYLILDIFTVKAVTYYTVNTRNAGYVVHRIVMFHAV